jgi:hypothetical protein
MYRMQNEKSSDMTQEFCNPHNYFEELCIFQMYFSVKTFQTPQQCVRCRHSIVENTKL